MSLLFAVWMAAGFMIAFAAALVVIVSNPRALLNRLFFGFALAIAALNALEFLMKITDSPARALYYFDFHVVAWFAFIGLLTHFAVVLARRERILRLGIGYLLIYGPIPVVGLLNWQTPWFYQGVVLQPWGYTQVFGPFYWVLSLYSILLFLGLIHYAGAAWWEAKSERERKQNRLIFFSFVITFIPTLLIEVLSKPFGLVLPPLIVQMSTIIVIIFGYAMVRYGLLVVTPADLAADILGLMPDLMLYTDNYERITLVNNELAQRLGPGGNGLAGAAAAVLFASAADYQALRQAIREKRLVKQRLIALKLGDGSLLPVDASGALVRDRFGEEIGTLYVFRDISEREQLLVVQRRMISELTETKRKMTELLAEANGARSQADRHLAEITRSKDDLEEFHKMAVGRELKMVELEKEVNALLKELGREGKYT
jgi:PAS domain S-box-containing protein